MRIYQARLRQLHRLLAPIMILPLLLTLITGSIYQLAEITGKEDSVGWVLRWHKGNFGRIDLQNIYSFLNALGLLTLIITGILMWFQMQRLTKRHSEEV